MWFDVFAVETGTGMIAMVSHALLNRFEAGNYLSFLLDAQRTGGRHLQGLQLQPSQPVRSYMYSPLCG